MRALVTRLTVGKGREKLLVTDWPEPPAPAGNQVKTQTLYSGVTNGTERNDLVRGNYAHPDSALPATWGYQNVGRVIETGPDVRELRVGDIVFSSSDHVEYATFAEDWLMVKLPPEVDAKEAALFGMASVAMHTCRNADLRIGERTLIVGAGCVGQFAAQIASAMGSRPTLCDIDPARLEVASRIGAAESIIDVSGDRWESSIADTGYDAVIDLAGVPGMEDRLMAAARQRGRVLFIAGRDRVSYTFNLGQWHELTIKQNSHFQKDDLENLCRLVERGRVQLAPLIRDVVPVAEAKRIYDTLRDRPSDLLGTVFVW